LYIFLLILVISYREEFISLWIIPTEQSNDPAEYSIDDVTIDPFLFYFAENDREFTYSGFCGYGSTREEMLVIEDYFDFLDDSNFDSNAFMVSTILDSSKIESLRSLHSKLTCSISQKCFISAAIFVNNLEDLCYSIDALRDIVRGGNIVISIVIRKSFFPMLIFNEESACSTYPYRYEEEIVWFPNNFLRNVARLPQKQTELNLPDFFIGIDVDLVPSPKFVENLSNFISTQAQRENDLYLIVVFEAKNQDVISSIQNKKDLVNKYPESVNIFHSWCDVCYNYYDYDRWLKLKFLEDLPEVGYEVQYKLSFEPYFLASNKMLPYHDSRFRGYGYNKVIHALLLSKQKYKFKVLSNPFLIHDGIKEETSGQSKTEQELNTKLFRSAKAQITENPFQFQFNPIKS